MQSIILTDTTKPVVDAIGKIHLNMYYKARICSSVHGKIETRVFDKNYVNPGLHIRISNIDNNTNIVLFSEHNFDKIKQIYSALGVTINVQNDIEVIATQMFADCVIIQLLLTDINYFITIFN